MVKPSTNPKKHRVQLKNIFLNLQKEMAVKLGGARSNIIHPSTMGDVSEDSWLQMLKMYLPLRYQAEKAFVLDSGGGLSQQIDIVVFDRHFSPFLLHQNGACYVPAESVYAVFEVKQDATKDTISYAASKAESVRRLKRTSAHIPHAGGRYEPKQPAEILAGLLALDSCWGKSFDGQLKRYVWTLAKSRRLNIGCVLKRGAFELVDEANGKVSFCSFEQKQALIQFFLRLLARLQSVGTVPAMDLTAYAAALGSK